MCNEVAETRIPLTRLELLLLLRVLHSLSRLVDEDLQRPSRLLHLHLISRRPPSPAALVLQPGIPRRCLGQLGRELERELGRHLRCLGLGEAADLDLTST